MAATIPSATTTPSSHQAVPPGSSTRPAPEGFLARRPVIGLGLLLFGGLLFSVLAVNVLTHGPLLAWDEPIIQALHGYARHTGWLALDAMRFSGTLGNVTATGITLMLVLYSLWKRRWRVLSMLVIGVFGGNAWFQVLSRLFGRHRPVFPDPFGTIPLPGFPSGHAMQAVLLYGLILYLLFPRLRSWRWRLLAALDAVSIMLLVGYSRLYVGDHYPTDVLGGYAFGLVWGALVYTGLELFHRSRRSAAPSKAAVE